MIARVAVIGVVVLACSDLRDALAHEIAHQVVISGASAHTAVAIEVVLQPDRAAPVVEIDQGQQVRLIIRGAGARQLHLHGFDVAVEGAADGPAVFEFGAERTGRFPLTVHGVENLLGVGEKTLLYVEVRKR